MDQTPNEIEAYIRETRADLGASLEEFERKVRTAADWREHVKNNPAVMLGAAFGGGLFLAMKIKGRRPFGVASAGAALRPIASRMPAAALETWDRIKDALVGVAATRLTDFVNELTPGFHDHYHRGRNSK